jgi:hypothetical protein
MPVHLSSHARKRAQQRRIPPLIVEWLFRFGSSETQGRTEVLFFDKPARNRLASVVGQPIVSHLTKLLDAYAIVEGDEVITVGHRYRRIRRA